MSAPLTLEQVIMSIRDIYGDDCADFSKAVYNGYHNKMTGVICNKCGKEYVFVPCNLFYGKRTKKCFCGHCLKEENLQKSRTKPEDFLKRAKEIHGENKFTYHMETWVDFGTPIKITCNDCGYEFMSTPTGHLSSGGCRKCADKQNSKRLSYDAETALQKMKESVHDVDYDYSKVIETFSSMKHPVTIICPTHGPFQQTPQDHCSGRGCPICGREKTDAKRIKTWDKVFEEILKVHGNKYDYSKVKYNNTKTNIEIVCPEHGSFFTTPDNHIMKNSGCPVCARITNGLKRRITFEKCVENFRKVHGDKYEYVKESWIDYKHDITILCPEHGAFKMKPNNHYNGQECPKCFANVSKQEMSLRDFISSLGIGISTSERKIVPGYELDIFIPNLNIAIEYNGVYWHSDKKIDKEYHITKTTECEKHGISLIHIFEDEWRFERITTENYLRNVLYSCDVPETFANELKFDRCKPEPLLWIKLRLMGYNEYDTPINYWCVINERRVRDEMSIHELNPDLPIIWDCGQKVFHK